MTAPDEFDQSRLYFLAVATLPPAPRYVALVGPLTPTPARTLAECVFEVAA